MNDTCTHPKVRYGASLFTSPTPVPWECPDCGSRGTAEIVEYLQPTSTLVGMKRSTKPYRQLESVHFMETRSPANDQD